jgi:hypothetical protein
MPAELNNPPCLVHGYLPRALHEENFFGIVTVIDEIISTISGVVGTTSFARCPYGYEANFGGVVRALEDLNTTISGIQGGGANIAAGSGIYTTTSGDVTLINSAIVGGSGVYITYSGSYVEVNASVTSASGIIYTAGSGLYLSDGGTRFNTLRTGGGVTVSGEPATPTANGDLWFDTNQGRLFVYASGNGVSDPAWYQTNSEAFVLKGELPPSGAGLNAPPRDGAVWFNTLVGNLFVYDAVTSGWYESGPSRSFAYGSTAPAPATEGAGWYSTADNTLKVWNGSSWITT